MNEIPTREIMWNVHSTADVVGLYSLLTVALLVGAAGIIRHYELWSSGKPSPQHLTNPFSRFVDLYVRGFLQQDTVRERTPAIAHTLIYLGFIVLLFTTTMVFLEHDLGIPIYRGDFYLGVTVLSDVFGLGVLFGCGIFAHRRYVQRSDKVHNAPADNHFLLFIALLVVQGFLLEGLRIHATRDPWAAYSPVGLAVSGLFWPLSARAASLLHYAIWWFHTITVFWGIAVIPYTKFFHMLASAANLYFKLTPQRKGALEYPGDIEKLVESGEEFSIGLESIKDYSWKQLLDLDACTSCGRCQDACPAYLSGKPLSPKWVILDTRNHAFALHAQQKLGGTQLPEPFRWADSMLAWMQLGANKVRRAPDGGGYIAAGEHRAKNELVQNSVRVLGGDAKDPIAGTVMDPDVFWSCTTCYACVEACPVGINQLNQIIGNRRNMVVMRGELPSEAQKALRSMENRGSPFGSADDKAKWMDGLDVPFIKPGDDVDYLYWVGCVSAFDPRKQKIAKALAKIMKTAGLSFGVLGSAEGCSGDPARRLGEENLYQTFAKQNIEMLRSIRFKTLVANCPHCFNTIKNEYPQFGNLGEGRQPEIIHHSVLLKRLLDENKLSLKPGAEQHITFHDPCYLARYNDEVDAPRSVLTQIGGVRLSEMTRSKEKGMCCGAGGGHFFMDMKIGTRINQIRVEQAAETGAESIATACPFCMQMLEDGVKLNNKEEALKVRDIAEILAEQLV